MEKASFSGSWSRLLGGKSSLGRWGQGLLPPISHFLFSQTEAFSERAPVRALKALELLSQLHPPPKCPALLAFLSSLVSPSSSFHPFFLVSESLFPISCRPGLSNNSFNEFGKPPSDNGSLRDGNTFTFTGAQHFRILLNLPGERAEWPLPHSRNREGTDLQRDGDGPTSHSFGLVIHWEKPPSRPRWSEQVLSLQSHSGPRVLRWPASQLGILGLQPQKEKAQPTRQPTCCRAPKPSN